MDTKQKLEPLIVVVGQTASGKSQLAMGLALKFGGEVISADSRTIYKGMDIGTAKPSLADLKAVKHHLIDITSPDRPITAADFKILATQAIDDISNRKKIPIMVGGSGLYIDSVIFDFKFGNKNGALRPELGNLSLLELQSKLRQQHLKLPFNEKNKRHLIRRLEIGQSVQKTSILRNNTVIIGIKLDRGVLKDNIIKRVDRMMSKGLKDEVNALSAKYGWDTEALKTIGYREFEPYFTGQQDLDQTRDLIISNTIRYARRQSTWFKRNKNIHWIEKQIQAVDIVTTFLNK